MSTYKFIRQSKLFIVLIIASLLFSGMSFLFAPNIYPNPTLGIINVPDGRVFDFTNYPVQDRRALGLINGLRDFYAVTDFSNASINDLSILPPVLTQYFLSFTTYGLAQIIDATPNYRSPYYQDLFLKLLAMMNSSSMEDLEWNLPGYNHSYYAEVGNGFRGPTNIMWTGHYALMELLYYNVFRDSCLNTEMKWFLDDWNTSLTATTTWDNHSANGLGLWGCGLIPCEPYIVFVQCNSIPFYTMRLYDRLFNTSYQQASIAGINWWQEHMVDDNGVQVDGYFIMEPDITERDRSDIPTSYPAAAVTKGMTKPKVSSYGSAWAISFFHAMGLTDLADQLYNDWKRMFVHYTTDNMAYTPNNYYYPNEFSLFDILGVLFGYFCAKEMNDLSLFQKLENWFYGPYQGRWTSRDKYSFDTSALGDLGKLLTPVLNFAFAYGHSPSALSDLMSPRNTAFFTSTPVISQESTSEGLFVYQAYYDEANAAFILTVEANTPTILTFDNYPNVQGVYTSIGAYSSWTQNGNQMLLTLSPGVHSFVIL